MIDKKIKTYGVILGVVLFVLLIAGFTYAALTWRSPNITITGNTECLEIEDIDGLNVNGEDLLLLDESDIISNNTITIKKGMILANISAKLSGSCSINGYLTLQLDVTSLNDGFTSSGNSTGALKYVVTTYNPDDYIDTSTNERIEINTNNLLNNTFEILKTGTITSVTNSDKTNKLKLTDGANLSTDSYLSYLVIFYIDGDLANNDIGGNDINFSATVEGLVTQGTLS